MSINAVEGECEFIGCDLHARQQTLAMMDTETGEVVNLMLMHEGNEVREFYSQLPRPVLVGIDGPRKGIANFLGVPHLYECLFDEEKHGFSDQFLLTAIDAETFQLRWKIGASGNDGNLPSRLGETKMSTHPALPHEAVRHTELKPILDRTLVTKPEKAVTKTGRFEPLGEHTLPIGVLRTLQVKWTEPLTNLNGTLRTMRFPSENDE